jgi:hypothetical protein
MGRRRRRRAQPRTADLLVHWAWSVIANVSEGDWDKQPPEWRDAAITWRDAYHRYLDALPPPPPGG